MAGNSEQPTAALVVTTIGRGDFIAPYFEAAVREGWLNRVQMIVIVDRNTPPEIHGACDAYARRGLDIRCPSLEEQTSFLERLGLKEIVPWNSDNRRNIGFLMALESGRDFLISIDDDNYCRPGEPFFEGHALVCRDQVSDISVAGDDGWFNICSLIELDDSKVYPRGFPFRHRHKPRQITRTADAGPVHLNAGMWLGEPDLDAITWLVNPSRAATFRGESVLLDRATWSPINTQNTALRRDAMVSYYYVRMGHPIGGLPIDRYGDIFSGYFCQACVRHMQGRVRVGTPVADHRRNSHNYMKDATQEMGGIWMIEELGDWIREVKLQGSTYYETYLSLAEALEQAAERFQGFIWTDATRGYLHQTAHCMRRWTEVCRKWI